MRLADYKSEGAILSQHTSSEPEGCSCEVRTTTDVECTSSMFDSPDIHCVYRADRLLRMNFLYNNA